MAKGIIGNDELLMSYNLCIKSALAPVQGSGHIGLSLGDLWNSLQQADEFHVLVGTYLSA